MDMSSHKGPQSVSWWITSLAMSIICCAILFVIFAGYLTDLKKQVNEESKQLVQMSAQQDLMLAEVQSLKRVLTPGAAAVTHAAAPVAPTTVPASPATEPTPANTPMTPPAAVPTAVPEVPATK